MLVRKLCEIIDIFVDNDPQVARCLMRRNVSGREALRHLYHGVEKRTRKLGDDRILVQGVLRSRDKAGSRWSYKRSSELRVLSHARLHAKGIWGQAAENRVWSRKKRLFRTQRPRSCGPVRCYTSSPIGCAGIGRRCLLLLRLQTVDVTLRNAEVSRSRVGLIKLERFWNVHMPAHADAYNQMLDDASEL